MVSIVGALRRSSTPRAGVELRLFERREECSEVNDHRP